MSKMELIKFDDFKIDIEVPERFRELLEEKFEYGFECQFVKRVNKHYTFYFISNYGTDLLYLDEEGFGEKIINDYEFFDRSNDPAPAENEFLNKIYTRREAENFVGLSNVAFQHHLRTGKIKPCKESGNGKGKVQLFFEDDLKQLKWFLEEK